MRKIILSMLLLLAGATTYAQVGINKEVPQATLDINAKGESSPSNTVEGLLIPRVSKEKALLMGGNTNLQESTLIYVNDFTYVSSDATVEDITENGYYFWNGTKWVKTVGQNGEEWVYDSTTKQINLKRSGQGDFKNHIYYNTETGQYVNTDTSGNIDVVNLQKTGSSMSENSTTTSISDIKSRGINLSLSSNLKDKNTLSYNYLYINEEDTNSSDPRRTTLSGVSIGSGNSNNYKSLKSNVTEVKLYGSGTIFDAVSNDTYTFIGGNQNITGSVSSTSTKGYITGSPQIENYSGLYSRNYFYSGGATIGKAVSGAFQSNMPLDDNSLIKEYLGVSSLLSNASVNTGTGKHMIGIRSQVEQLGQTKYPDIYGIYSITSIDPSAVKPDNLYGLYIGDATGATTKNYSIYTNTGDIRFGDLADSNPALVGKDRLVITNAEGVLSASDDVLEDFVSLWANDVPNTRVYLKKTSAGVDREDSGSNRNSVTISDAGAITAKGFIGYNGASIFPDYVFEKYYKGYSDIKADYDFHNLTSVETFIKKNGHLPGYQSAKEIAKEGLIDIGATQLTNVEKIEELYLHTIEQEKAIKEKDARIDRLEIEVEELKAMVQKLINK